MQVRSNYFRNKYDLPQPVSFNGSNIMWLPNELDFDCMILIEEEPSHSSTWFHSTNLVDSIRNPNARDKGYIHFRENPKLDLKTEWREAVKEVKGEFNFK